VDGDGAGEQGDDEPGALPLDRAAALEQIRVALGMPEIEGFEREGRQPVVYRVVLKGQTVTVGGASKLRQQAAFRDALFDATGRWPTRVKKRSEWERLTAMMHRIAERIEVGEGDADIAMVSLVADYCGYGGAVDVVDPDRMTVEWSRPGRRAEPYIIGGRLHVQLRALAQHALQQGERVSIEQLARRLRRIGFAKAAPKTLRLIPEVVAQYASGDASDLKAMRTTLRAWVLVPGKCPDLDSMVAQVVRADARERREQAERRS
jgi:hypothetical protein